MGSGTLYNLLARVVFLASGYALQFGMARWLASPADYGRFGVLMSLITLARTVLSTGLPQAITQFVAAEPATAEATYRRGAALQLLGAAGVTLAFLGLVPLLTRFLGDGALGPLLLLASPLLVLMAFYQVNLGYISGRLWFGRQALLTFVYSLLRYGASAALVLLGFGIGGAVCGQLLATFAVALLSFLAIPRAGQASPIGVRRFLDFSWPLLIFSFGVSALLNLDLLLLGRFFPASDKVGFYSGAVNLGKAPYYVFYAFSATTLPALARHHAAGDAAALRAALSKQLRFLLFGALPCAGLLAVTAAPSLALVYGAPYAAAAPALALLALSSCALSLLVVLASALTACGKPRTSMLLVLVCLPAQAALGTLLIPESGMVGAATSNLLATLGGLCVALVLVRRTIGDVWNLRALASAALSTFAAAALTRALPTAGGVWLLVEIALGFVAYGLALWLTGGVTSAEVARLSRKALGGA